MRTEEIKAGMLIAYKSNRWATKYDLFYIVKVTPKNFRVLNFYMISTGAPAVNEFRILKMLWPKDEITESRLANNKEKFKVFNGIFTAERAVIK
jgi:hypothetical protein